MRTAALSTVSAVLIVAASACARKVLPAGVDEIQVAAWPEPPLTETIQFSSKSSTRREGKHPTWNGVWPQDGSGPRLAGLDWSLTPDSQVDGPAAVRSQGFTPDGSSAQGQPP